VVFGPAESCGAVQKNCSVFSVRSAASARVIQACSTPIGYAVSAKPTAAMLENDAVGQRSGVRPFVGGVRSQKKLKVRCCRVSRNADVSGATPGPPELPAQPPRARARATATKRLQHPLRS